MIKTEIIKLKSHNPAPKLMDITKKVEQVVKKSKVRDGQVLVFSRHTTAAVVLQEPEPGLLKDIPDLLRKIAPKENHYHHSLSPDHQADQMPNGHSHCQHLLLGSSEIVPLSEGQMLLGTYQKIFLVELDRTRIREIVVQISGE